MKRHHALLSLLLIAAPACYNPEPLASLEAVDPGDPDAPEDPADPEADEPAEPADPGGDPEVPSDPDSDEPAQMAPSQGVWRLDIDPRPFGAACGVDEAFDTQIVPTYGLVGLWREGGGWTLVDHSAQQTDCDQLDGGLGCSLADRLLLAGLRTGEFELEMTSPTEAAGTVEMSVTCGDGVPCPPEAFGIRLPCHGSTTLTARFIEEVEVREQACSGSLRTLSQAEPAFATFSNTSDEARRIEFVDADGDVAETLSLEPGETVTRSAAVSQAYRALDLEGACLGNFVLPSEFGVILVP